MKKLFLIRFSVAAFFCLLCVLPALAANIKIKGAVKDKLSKEPLIGATIRLLGTQAGAVTDMEGNFELNSMGVLEGMYDIEIKYVGYKTEVRRKVRVENGKLVILNLELETDAQELADVVVVAKKNRENENMLLLEQQKAVIAVQSVGVRELSRKGVSDAEGAVTKVAGVSKQDGVKNVFVRGLGDRYNATTFNGFALPSEDPEYKNISLDFFGTDVIQSVGVNKAFNAGGSSDVGGATIDIVSKELIYRYTIHVGRRINSSAVIANAWHHRSDAFSSIGTAIGIEGAILLGESWSVLDPMAAVVVSFFIMKVSVQLLKPCVDELTEKSLPDEIEKEICLITENTPGVSAIHNLRTRRIGNHYAIEMHVRMDGHLTLYEAHAKASVIENKLKEKYGNETHVGIHVEPVKSADGTYEE